jgi:hypothetical protein
MNCPFLGYLRDQSPNFSWRTMRRYMALGLIPGAYRTKGGHWRIRRPRGAKPEDVILWIDEAIHGPNPYHSPSLWRWIDKVWKNIERHEQEHPRGRNTLARKARRSLTVRFAS